MRMSGTCQISFGLWAKAWAGRGRSGMEPSGNRPQPDGRAATLEKDRWLAAVVAWGEGILFPSAKKLLKESVLDNLNLNVRTLHPEDADGKQKGVQNFSI